MEIQEKIIQAIKRATGVGEVHLETPEREEHGDYATNIALAMFGKSEIRNPKSETNSKKQKLKIKTPLEHEDIQSAEIGADQPPHTTHYTQLTTHNLPRDLAEAIVERLRADEELAEVVDKIEVAGPGFINFWLKKEILFDVLVSVLKQNDTFGRSEIKKGKSVIVEYSSPNIAKPFTVGHLRSTVIGGAIANLLEVVGWKVLRDNHLGDWGTQFGKQIYAIKTWGNEKVIESSDNPVKELVALYVKFHQEAEKDPSIEDKGREWFKKLEDGDEEAKRLWKKCVEWSWQEFDKIYETLDVEFSEEFDGGRGLGESYFNDKMEVVISDLESKGLLQEGEEGARLVFFENEKYPPAMILKKDGATLYHTRDLATDKYRKETYDPDLIINEVGAEQTLYFRQLFEMEKMLGWFDEAQRVHVPHGLIRFKDKKMSTRKGNVVWMEEILEEAVERARKLGSDSDELAQVVAVGAIKWNDLKRDPKTEIIFDWDEMLSMDGNSGPYLQYTYARTQSLLRKFKTQNSEVKTITKSTKYEKLIDLSYGFDISDMTFELNDEELSLLRHFVHYPGIIINAAKNYSPNVLCNYLYELAQKYNSFYNAHRILQDTEEKHEARNSKHETNSNDKNTNDTNVPNLEKRDFRLALTAATGQILKNGLDILGIKVPEKM